MKKLYFLDEQEKNRILNLHTEATKSHYLANKKLLVEGFTPRLASNMLGNLFRRGRPGLSKLSMKTDGIIDEFFNLTAANQKAANMLITHFDDFLDKKLGKTWDEWVHRVEVTDPSGKNVIMEYTKLWTGTNYIDSDKIVSLFNSIKGNGTPTKLQVETILESLPRRIEDVNLNEIINLQADFRKYLETNTTLLKSTTREKIVKGLKLGGNIPLKAGIVAASAYVAFNLVREASKGESRRQYSNTIQDYITSCNSKENKVNPRTTATYTEEALSNISTRIFEAKDGAKNTFYLDATDDVAIKEALESLKNWGDFCKLSDIFHERYRDNPQINNRWYKSAAKGDYDNALARFFDWEYTGAIYGDPTGDYFTYVVDPIQKLKLKSNPTKPDGAPDGGGGGGKTPPKEDLLQKLTNQWGTFAKTYPCVIESYKNFSGSKQIFTPFDPPDGDPNHVDFWALSFNGWVYYPAKNAKLPLDKAMNKRPLEETDYEPIECDGNTIKN